MTVSELIGKLRDCAPNAEVVQAGLPEQPITQVASDGEEVRLC